jgi:hemerythrin-like metal-binding protein
MLSNMTLPDWLYEPLPLIYTASRVLVILGMDSNWGLFSGLMLLSAGVLIWRTRRIYRNAHRRKLRTKRVAQPLYEPPPLKVMDSRGKPTPLVWDTAHECGYPPIDSQHRHLFELANNLLSGILSEQDKVDLELLLDDLLAALARHCEAEELFLLKIQHPDTAVHQDHHRHLLDRCRALAERYHQDQISAQDVYTYVAKDLITGHILSEDTLCLGNHAAP